MNHFSDTLWYTPMEPKSFPFFYPLNHFSQNDDIDSQTDDYADAAAASAATNDTRSETASSYSGQHSDNREHMFEKPLTPSDVGKLNRLVIPKQHAEKYFPLSGVSSSGGGGDGGGATGVLLGFEDETGKSWRFRYSYWNSSQSYVLTKGWSRYVKEKKLDAGDVVLFERHRFEPDRFFIGWRRRGSNAAVQTPVRGLGEEFGGWTGGGQRSSLYNTNAVHIRQGYPVPQPQRIATAPFQFQATDCSHAGTEIRQQSQTPPRSGGGNSRRLRLFGVNLECQLENDDEAEPQTSDGSSLSSQGPVHGSVSVSVFGSSSGSGVGPMSYNYFDYAGYPPNHDHNHMDINFPQDVNQMGNRLG